MQSVQWIEVCGCGKRCASKKLLAKRKSRMDISEVHHTKGKICTYTLELENEKWWVGYSQDLEKRFRVMSHFLYVSESFKNVCNPLQHVARNLDKTLLNPLINKTINLSVPDPMSKTSPSSK